MKIYSIRDLSSRYNNFFFLFGNASMRAINALQVVKKKLVLPSQELSRKLNPL